MNPVRFVLSQILDLLLRQTLDCPVKRYDAESDVRHFGCRQQLIGMVFAQLTWREVLRDIATILNAEPSAWRHHGFGKPVARSTLPDANEQRDLRLWDDLAKGLARKARRCTRAKISAWISTTRLTRSIRPPSISRCRPVRW